MFLALTFDFWLALTLCILSSFVWLFIAWKQHSGGSYYWKMNQWGQRIEKVYDGKKIPLHDTPAFKIFLVHFFAGLVVFILIASDFWDVWFS